MAATTGASPPLSPPATGGVDPDDSNISSPLSEVDDKDDNDEELERMRLGGGDGDNSSAAGEEDNQRVNHNDDDSDSALSEANSDLNSDMNDTEAETERLYDTPQTQRRRDVYNDGHIFEHTPSRLRSANTLRNYENGHDDDEESRSGDEASVASGHEAEDPSTKYGEEPPTVEDEEAKDSSQERKRKRSPVAEQSDSEGPLRKRKGSVGALQSAVNADLAADQDDSTPPDQQDADQSAEEDEGASPRKQIALETDSATRETRASRKTTRSESRRKAADEGDVDGAAGSEAVDEPHDGVAGEDTENQDEENQDEGAEADVEEEADIQVKNQEELERKEAAFKDWTHIEDMFGVFRDRLYKDRLRRLEEEEQSLLADVPTHPEYLNMKQCIDNRLKQTTDEVDKELEFRIKAHERRAVAQRAQIWSQYFQAVRERREEALEVLNKGWYEVQAARRTAHSLPDYGILFPKVPSMRLRNAIAYNSEVSTLAGIAKYEGFPAAPSMSGASQMEVQDDLNAIDHARRSRQKPPVVQPVQPREDYQPTTFSSLGAAGEQFIKDTPWANPNHSAHKAHQPGPAAASENASGQLGPASNISGAQHTQSIARAGQVPDKGNASTKSRAPSVPTLESAELSRSMASPASHQVKRMNNVPAMARGSKTAAA